MPTQCFALLDSASSPLEVSWQWGSFFAYTHLKLKLSDKEIGTIATEAQINESVFQLPDGSKLRVRLRYSNLAVTQNDQPLRKCQCAEEPQVTLNRVNAVITAWGWIGLIYGGVVAVFWPHTWVTYLLAASLGLLGALYLLFGVMIKRNSLFALVMTGGVLIVNIGLMVVLFQQERWRLGTTMHWIILFANFVLTLKQGLTAVMKLRQTPEGPTQSIRA